MARNRQSRMRSLIVTTVMLGAACSGVSYRKEATPGTYTLTASEKNAGHLDDKARDLCPHGFQSSGQNHVQNTQTVCVRSPANGGGSLCERQQDVTTNEVEMTITCTNAGATQVAAPSPATHHNPAADLRAELAHYDEIAAKQANDPEDDALSLALYQARQLDIERMKLVVLQQFKVDPDCFLLDAPWLDGGYDVRGCGSDHYHCDALLRCTRMNKTASETAVTEVWRQRERYDNVASVAKQHMQPPCEGERNFQAWQAATGEYYVVSTCRPPHGEALSWVRYRCQERACQEIKPDDYDRAAHAELKLRACRGSVKVAGRTLSCKPIEP